MIRRVDCTQHPITIVICSVPNISVNWFVRNWNNSQVGFVAVLPSKWIAVVKFSSCVEVRVRRTSENRKMPWLGNVGNTASITFSKVDSWIPDDWSGELDIIIIIGLVLKYLLGIRPCWEELWNNPLPDALLPPVWVIDGVGRSFEEELDDGLHQDVLWHLHHIHGFVHRHPQVL